MRCAIHKNRILMAALVLGLFPVTARAATLLECAFDRDGDLEGWSRPPVGEFSIQTPPGGEDGEKALRIHFGEHSVGGGLYHEFPKEAVAGRRLRFSAEFKGEAVAASKDPWNGGKFMFRWHGSDGKNRYPQGKLRRGDFDWEPVQFDVTLPDDITQARLSLGFQDSFGTLWVRKLKVEALDAVLDLAPVANMGLKDPVAGDGKGGWTDQGPENDASAFPWFKAREYAKVPFSPADPEIDPEKVVAVFKSKNFPGGLESVDFDLATLGKRGRYLYLLHTASHAAKSSNGVPAGFIDLLGGGEGGDEATKTLRTLPVKIAEDVRDWWNPIALSNAAIGAVWNTPASDASGAEKGLKSQVGVYVSRFDLDAAGANAPAGLRLRSADGPAIWVVLAAILSDEYYPMPGSARHVLEADETWKALKRPARPTVVPGSVLDRSVYLDAPEPAGGLGRLIATPEGHLAFADAPDKPVRFLSSCEATGPFIGNGRVKPQLDTHEKTEAYVRELRANGYNMTRVHFLDSIVSRSPQKKDGSWKKRGPGDGFNPRMLDRFEYYVHCLKQNGIYLNLDAMTGTTGYTGIPYWSAQAKSVKNRKFHIHFDPEIRADWARNVEALLTRVNPYTQTRLVDDPVLAIVIAFNEHPFAFTRFLPADPGPEAMGRWRGFLRGRYGDFAALKAAWGVDAPDVADFDAVPFFVRADVEDRDRTAKGADVRLFIRGVERETGAWFRAELRRMGYHGLFTASNMGSDWHGAGLRNDDDLAISNLYQDHPTGGSFSSGATVTHAGAIGQLAGNMRKIMAPRLAGKARAITEHAIVFWNRHRYEQGFVVGGYGAYQDFSLLTAYGMPIDINPEPQKNMHSYAILHDPILRASEYLTFFLFSRGDLRPARAGVRVVVDWDGIYDDRVQNEAMAAPQSKISLITGLSTSVVEKGDAAWPLRPGEVAVPRVGGNAAILNDAGFEAVDETVADETFDLDAFVGELKRRGLLPENNRSAPASDIFESDTGELYLDGTRQFLSINTPRLQGVCGVAGATADFGVLRVLEMTTKGNLALVAVDGDKPLAEADRMALVYATDALNSGMSFHDPECHILQELGGNPTLIETGRFRVALRHPRAQALRMWALDLGGGRRSEVKRAEGGAAGEAVFAVDTAKLPDGPALFFELAME